MVTPEWAVAATATTPGMPPYQDTFRLACRGCSTSRMRLPLEPRPPTARAAGRPAPSWSGARQPAGGARTALLREPPPRGILNEDRERRQQGTR